MKNHLWFGILVLISFCIIGCSDKPETTYLNGQALIVDTEANPLVVIGSRQSEYGYHTYYPDRGQILVENKRITFEYTENFNVSYTNGICVSTNRQVYEQGLGHGIVTSHYQFTSIKLSIDPVNWAFMKARYSNPEKVVWKTVDKYIKQIMPTAVLTNSQWKEFDIKLQSLGKLPEFQYTTATNWVSAEKKELTPSVVACNP